MPESLWIELKDPEQFEGITSAVVGLDGVSGIRDARDTLKPIYGTIDALQWGALGTALFLVVAALLLVANTIRLAAFARRREIGIMRLVGASTLYIALPFLLEAVVTAVLGVALAAGALAAFEKFGIKDRIQGELNFIPWIDWPEVQYAVAGHRDPRAAAHVAADTRADAQIPQSVSPAPFAERRACRRCSRRSRLASSVFTSPNTQRRTGAFLPPHRLSTLRRGRCRAGRRRRSPQRPLRARRRPPASCATAQKAVHKKIEKADHELEESSAALRRATQALSHAREQLDRGARRAGRRTGPAGDRAAARRGDEGGALRGRGPARAGAAPTCRTASRPCTTQRELVVDTITAIYEQGDPDLMAFTSILNAQTPADITRQREASSSLVQRQDNEYDDLRAAEVLLKVHEDEVEEATAEVAEKRQEAADHLVEMQGLTQEALDAKERVQGLVGDRKDAEAMAVQGQAEGPQGAAEAEEAGSQDPEADPGGDPQGSRARSPQGRPGQPRRPTQGGPPIDTNGLLMHPVNGPVTSPFGYREHPIYHYWGLHDGDDFGAPCGAPLVAVRGGKVLTEYYSSVWGNRLYLNVGMVNGNFITVIYNHLSRYNVGVGATVDRGDVVGYVGTTGWSTGCHLHFTVMENGKPVDPMKYF